MSCACRDSQCIETTQQLVGIIGQTRLRSSASDKRKGSAKHSHPATRTFQALRIAVNDELRACEAAVPAAIKCLRPGGRLAVITFHSLEDRIVKWAMRTAAGQGKEAEDAQEHMMRWHELGADADNALHSLQPAATVRLVNRRPIVASAEEQERNIRSRTAKLRVVEKL